MLTSVVVLYILQLVTAPTWCYVLCWITLGAKIFEFLVDVIKDIVKGEKK